MVASSQKLVGKCGIKWECMGVGGSGGGLLGAKYKLVESGGGGCGWVWVWVGAGGSGVAHLEFGVSRIPTPV